MHENRVLHSAKQFHNEQSKKISAKNPEAKMQKQKEKNEKTHKFINKAVKLYNNDC